MDSLFYLFLAYTFIWGLIFWYTRRLNKQQEFISEELRIIKKSLEEKLPIGG